MRAEDAPGALEVPGAQTAIVIGTDSDWDVAERLVKGAEQVLFYSLEAAVRLQDALGYRGEVIDVTGLNAEIEGLAWDWTVGLVAHMQRHAGWLSAEVLRIARRALLLNVFMPIAAARVRATTARSRIPKGMRLAAYGMSALDCLEIGGCENPEQSAGEHAPAVPAPSGGGALGRAFGFIRGVARSAVRGLGEGRRVRRLGRFARGEDVSGPTQGPLVGVLLGAPIHARLLETCLRELHSRGWQSLGVVFHAGQELGDEARRVCSRIVGFDDFAPRLDTFSKLVRKRIRARNRGRTTVLVCEWAESVGLGTHGPDLARGVWEQYWEVERLVGTHRTWLRITRPAVVLAVNEIAPRVETVVPAASRLRIPAVDVQHGSIMPTPLNSEFSFDAICVFGDAYAENLAKLGTEPARIRTTGNPFMDTSRGGGEVPGFAEPEESHGVQAATRPFTILFAGGYAWERASDASLYATLKIVLEYMERDADCRLVLKLHPVAAGKEFGYEVALHEHPNLDVVAIRDANLHALIAQADCVATQASTVAIEAASFRTPSIILSPGDHPDMLPLVAEGVGLRAVDSEEFGRCVERLRRGDAILDEAYAAFDRRYAYEHDGRAGVRIADICEELALRAR